MKLTDFFDKILLLNLKRRPDRLLISMQELARFDLLNSFERFEAVDNPANGNAGCTASHRAILELIIQKGWKRTLILEDDFKITHPDFHHKFEVMAPFVPADWDMLYLGGHYAEPPIARVNKHVIKMGRMFTTSSYGITLEFARKIAHTIEGISPIDCLFGNHHAANNCYIFQPRLMVQRESYSDLCERVMDNEPCMTDVNHENMV